MPRNNPDRELIDAVDAVRHYLGLPPWPGSTRDAGCQRPKQMCTGQVCRSSKQKTELAPLEAQVTDASEFGLAEVDPVALIEELESGER